MPERLNIDEPLWDLTTFVGRLKHFAWVTDPRTALASEDELDQAKILLNQYRAKQEPKDVTIDKIIYAKKLYESAFHPDSGEKQNVFGRMSFQMPGGMLITGAMLQWYRTVPAVVFWQWMNQSFNALVNYTNRNAKSPLTTNQLVVAYVSATSAACVTAIGFKSYLQKHATPFLQRYVPFAAVAAANCVNIPLMRQNELIHGVDLQDSKGRVVCTSKYAPIKGISQVILSRIIMCAPGMLILPIIMNRLEKYRWMQSIKPLHGPFQVMLVGCFLTVMVPTACALFPQKCAYSVRLIEKFEPAEYEKLQKLFGEKDIPRALYFNKGL